MYVSLYVNVCECVSVYVSEWMCEYASVCVYIPVRVDMCVYVIVWVTVYECVSAHQTEMGRARSSPEDWTLYKMKGIHSIPLSPHIHNPAGKNDHGRDQ